MVKLSLSKLRRKLVQSHLNSCYLSARKKTPEPYEILFYCMKNQEIFLEFCCFLKALMASERGKRFHVTICRSKKAPMVSIDLGCEAAVLTSNSPSFYTALGTAGLIFYDSPLPPVFIPRPEQLLFFVAGSSGKSLRLPPVQHSAALRLELLSADFILGLTREAAGQLIAKLALEDRIHGQFLYPETSEETRYFGAMKLFRESVSFQLKEPKSEGAKSDILSNNKNVRKPSRKRVLIFCSDLRRNGMTTSLLNLLHLSATDEFEYCFTYREEAFANTPERLSLLPEGSLLLPVYGSLNCGSLFETICHSLYLRFHIGLPLFRKKTEQLYARAYERFFGHDSFDAVIHYTGYSQEFLLLFGHAAAKRILFVHNDMLEEYREKRQFHLGVFKHACRNYDVVAAVSQSVRNSLKKIDPKLKNVMIIENTHDDERIRSLAEQPFILDSDSSMNISSGQLEEVLAGDKRKFINISRYSPEKGQKKLIDAFAVFHRTHPDTVLLLIGGYGPLYEELISYCAALSCGNDIILIQNVSNPYAILKRCNLFLLPSDREPLGLVLLEADSLGLPAAATDIPGSGDFLKRYGGYLVSNDVNGLIKAMEDFLAGKLHPLGIDFQAYNKKIVNEFLQLLRS